MSENNNVQKNPLELALETFQDGTQKIENANKELDELIEMVLDKHDEFTTHEKKFNKNTDVIINLLSNNLELYQNATRQQQSVFKDLLKKFQADFQQQIDSCALVTLNLNEEDRKNLEQAGNRIKQYRKYFYFVLGSAALLLITIALSGFLSLQFYKTSIQTKTEVRQEFLEQLRNRKEIIVDENLWNALRNERDLIKIWSKSNPNDSKSLDIFRKGIISGNSKIILFENNKNSVIEYNY